MASWDVINWDVIFVSFNSLELQSGIFEGIAINHMLEIGKYQNILSIFDNYFLIQLLKLSFYLLIFLNVGF